MAHKPEMMLNLSNNERHTDENDNDFSLPFQTIKREYPILVMM